MYCVFLLDMPFNYTQLCHVLPQLHMLELSIGKGRQIHKLMYVCRSRLASCGASACAQVVCALESSSYSMQLSVL